MHRQSLALERALRTTQLLGLPAEFTMHTDTLTASTRFDALCHVCLKQFEIGSIDNRELTELSGEPGLRSVGHHIGKRLNGLLIRGYMRHPCLFTADPEHITWQQAQQVAQQLESTLQLLGELQLYYTHLAEQKCAGEVFVPLVCRHAGVAPTICGCSIHCGCRRTTCDVAITEQLGETPWIGPAHTLRPRRVGMLQLMLDTSSLTSTEEFGVEVWDRIGHQLRLIFTVQLLGNGPEHVWSSPPFECGLDTEFRIAKIAGADRRLGYRFMQAMGWHG